MAAQRQHSPQQGPATDPSLPERPDLVTASDESHEATASPALELQAALSARLDEAAPRFSGREILASFVVFCFAAWWALYLVATGLF